MKDINRYVTRKYAVDWKDIGIELDLELATLDTIEKDHPLQSEDCFQAMIDKWLRLTGDNATWKALEVALTNVNRQKLDLDPVDDVYGMTKFIYVLVPVLECTTYRKSNLAALNFHDFVHLTVFTN